MDATNCFTFPANVVGNYLYDNYLITSSPVLAVYEKYTLHTTTVLY